MRLPIIVCILVCIGPVARSQLNFLGNPLTENTDYKAEESHFSERNEPRSRVSNLPFASSANQHEEFSSINKTAKTSLQVERATLPQKNEKIGKNLSITNNEKTEKIGSISGQSGAEGRQLNDYSVDLRPLESQRYQSANSPISIDRSHPSYQSYKASPSTLASGEALNKFLQSRTPEESQAALQNYFQVRDSANQGSRSVEVNSQDAQTSSDLYTLQNDAIRNQMVHQEILNSEEMMSRPLITQHSPRWNKIGIQSRRDLPIAGPGRRLPYYRGQMVGMGGGRQGLRQGKPWYQSRIGPGPPPGYRTIFTGPPPPPASLIGKRKPAPELIYTKPPGFGHGPPNDVIPYEDGPWHEESSPPQKDILWSQLYAQSYDPHYYNYIAKTGKIKPWLYGKLGEKKEKSIWWELFAGFKKHGMKNIMNPMFLLGMTIPTLTLMLTALVQKRSLARSSSGYVTEELIEEYARMLQDAIECNEKRVNASEENKCW